MRPLRSHSLSEAVNVESFMREIRSACSVVNRSAPETIPDLAEMWLGWLHELLGQKRALQGRHAVLKPEVGEVIGSKDENEDAVVYGDTRPVKRSRRKEMCSFYPCRGIVRCPVYSDLGTSYQ